MWEKITFNSIEIVVTFKKTPAMHWNLLSALKRLKSKYILISPTESNSVHSLTAKVSETYLFFLLYKLNKVIFTVALTIDSLLYKQLAQSMGIFSFFVFYFVFFIIKKLSQTSDSCIALFVFERNRDVFEEIHSSEKHTCLRKHVSNNVHTAKYTHLYVYGTTNFYKKFHSLGLQIIQNKRKFHNFINWTSHRSF